MGLSRADSVALSYSNVEAAKQWWIDTFDCKVVRVPQDRDSPLPSDVALALPGDSEPTILLSALVGSGTSSLRQGLAGRPCHLLRQTEEGPRTSFWPWRSRWTYPGRRRQAVL